MKSASMSILRNVSVAVVASLLLSSLAIAKEKNMVLESTKISKPITLKADDGIWKDIKPLVVPLTETPYKPDNFPGIIQTEAILKSVYDDKNIYIYMQYDDPTRSVDRYPWIKQEDGSWKRMRNKDQTNHENTYYEDKAAFYWNINARGFEKRGCAISCHMAKSGMNNGIADTSPGRKYTRKKGQTIDMWHWKAVRTGLPFDLTHDQYVNHVNDPKENKNWGRHGDEKTAGGYKTNISKDKKTPMYMSKNPDNTLTYLFDEDKVPFVDNFKAGDMVPAIVVSKMIGSAGDIETSNHYADGKWTLVFKRALTTNHPNSKTQDVQFADLKKPYYFGISAFDNTQINHMYHEGSIKLIFK